MATTSLSLGPYWDNFIRREVAAGRHANASDVIRAALREYEDKRRKLDALRTHLSEGIEQADQGDFVADFDIGTLVSNADKRRSDRR